ncbi:MAG: glycoside hydrolase family 65 protein [Pseudonocardiaceae bacterium]
MRFRPSSDEWLITASGFDPERANVAETLFTIGNGRLGTRGSLEEGHQGELSGTYLNGVYDGHDAPVIDLVNAPDWLPVAIFVGGVRLDVLSCVVRVHERALDLRQGVLLRTTVFEDGRGRRTRLDTLRFASMSDRSLCGVRVEITPENHRSEITVESAIDGRRRNLERLPVYPDGAAFPVEMRWEKWARTKHLEEVDKDHRDGTIYLEMQTIDSRIRLGYAATTVPSQPPAGRSVRQGYEWIAEQACFDVPAGETLRIDKLVAIFTSRDPEAEPGTPVRPRCLDAVAAHRAASFDACLASSTAAWARLWADSDCEIVGDAEATKAVRFSIYHLLIAANRDDPAVSIGAKSLSGEGYRGHVFWDTEIFMLPFFTYTQPDAARALLSYRHHTLPGAREVAIDDGRRGARYAWESADSGREECPRWTPDGANRLWMGEQEIHVTADVAYGVLSYVGATGDTGFLLEYGAEILFETSRFWADRVTFSAERGGYELTTVTGPDEFHPHVDNNAFTNRMVKWHLTQSIRAYDDLKTDHPAALAQIASLIGLASTEVDRWRTIATDIVDKCDRDRALIEQFDGYLRLADVPITEWDGNDMPRYPEGYHHFNCEPTTLLKQPDVIMLMYLLPDEFTAEVKQANFDYYEARTLHKSSLSPAIHAIMGIEVGDVTRALPYFNRSAFVDLANNQGNTAEGIHIASCGGTWQALVCGFGGFRVRHGAPSFDPWLPDRWTEIRFRLRWRRNTVAVTVRHTDATFLLDAPDGVTEQVLVCGTRHTLAANEPAVIPLGRMASPLPATGR